MARLFTSGFESQHYFSEGFASTTSGYTADATVQRVPGTRASAYVDSGSPATAPFIHLSFTSTNGYYYYVRQYIRRTTADGQAGIIIATFRNTASVAQLSVKLNASHQLQLFNSNSAANIGSPSATLEANRWYCMEIGVMLSGTGAADSYAELRLDGVSLASSATETYAVTALGGFRFGWYSAPTANQRIYYDDMALNDNQGANQNSWPGEGVDWLLLPTSDNARGTNWYCDNAQTTALYNALDNTPPKGATHSTANAADVQVYNVVSGAGQNLDVNMQTYTAAGIGDVEVIKLVQMAADSGTNGTTARAHNAYIVSNPAETAPATYTTPTAAAGAYPTNWKHQGRTTLYNPTVTRGTAPVARLSKEVNNVAAILFCYAGITVETQPVTGSRSISTVSASVGSPSYSRDITGVSAAVQATVERAISGVSAAAAAYDIERAISGISASVSVIYTRDMTGVSAAAQALGVERSLAGVSAALLATNSREVTAVSAALLGTSERAITGVSAAVAAYGVERPITGISATVTGSGTRPITGISAAVAAYGVERPITGVSASASGAFVRPITGVSAATRATVSLALTGISASLATRTDRAITGVGASVLAIYDRAITGVGASVLATATRAITGVSAALKATGVTRPITGVSAAVGQGGIERAITGVSAVLQATVSKALIGVSASLVQPQSRPITGVSGAVKATGVSLAITGVSAAAGQGAIGRSIAGVSGAVAWDTSGKTFAFVMVRGARGAMQTRTARGRVRARGTRCQAMARGTRGTIKAFGTRDTITVKEE